MKNGKGIANTATVSYKWSEKGKQPHIEQQQRKRERRTVFGCVNSKTGQAINLIAEAGNTKTFFSFLLKVNAS